MSLTNTQYDIILRGYENKQLNTRHELERRTKYVYEHIPAYRELEDNIATLSVSQGKKYLEGNECAIEELKAELARLSQGKRSFLKMRVSPQII